MTKNLLVFLLVALLGAGALAQDVGMVTDVKGGVEVQLPGAKWQAVNMLLGIPNGAKLKVPEKASVSIASYADGSRMKLVGPSLAKVESGTLQITEGDKKALSKQEVRTKKAGLKPVSTTMGAAYTRRQPAFRLLSVGLQSKTQPTLAWSPHTSSEVFTYRIVLSDGARELLNQTTEQTEIEAPELSPGTYRLTLEALDDLGMGVESVEGEFTVGSADLSQRISALWSQAEAETTADDPTALVLLSSHLYQQKCYWEALQVVRRCLTIRPGDKGLMAVQAELLDEKLK